MSIHDTGCAGQPASGPGETAEAATPTIEHPDAALIALEQEHDQLEASIKGLPEDETDRRASRVMEMARELWELPAHTLHGAAAKLRVLRYHADQTEQEDYVRCSDTALEALDRLGDVNLILWEQEYNRLWNTDYKTETEAGQEALDRACEEWNGIYDKIVETLAHTPEGVAVKVRMLRHNLRQGDNRERDDRAWDSCLASLANMAGTPTPVPSATLSHPMAGRDPDESIVRLWQERGRLTTEADEILAFDRDDPDTDKRANVLDEKATEIEKRIASMTATGPTGWAVQVALLALWMERGLRADKLDLQLVARLGAYFLGTVSPLLEVAATGNPDAKLFVLEAEMKAAHEGFHAAAVVGSTDEDHQPWYDRMIAVEEAAQAIPAQTAMGVLAKVRMAAWYQRPKPSEDNEAHEIWLRNIVADAERIGTTVTEDDPDAELQSLWRDYLRNRDEWDKPQEDTPEYERCSEVSTEIAERIIATPAQGVHGLAVKLMIGTNVPYAHRSLADHEHMGQDERGIISARNDAVRLTGIEGAS